MGDELVREGTYEIWVSNKNSLEEAIDFLHDEGWRAMSAVEKIYPEDAKQKPRFRIRGAVLHDAVIIGRRIA